MSPFLAWGDFHAHSRFVRSTIPREKGGTTRSLDFVTAPGRSLKLPREVLGRADRLRIQSPWLLLEEKFGLTALESVKYLP